MCSKMQGLAILTRSCKSTDSGGLIRMYVRADPGRPLKVDLQECIIGSDVKQIKSIIKFWSTIIDFWNFNHFWISKARPAPSSRVANQHPEWSITWFLHFENLNAQNKLILLTVSIFHLPYLFWFTHWPNSTTRDGQFFAFLHFSSHLSLSLSLSLPLSRFIPIYFI